MGQIGPLLTAMTERTTGLANALAEGIESADGSRVPLIDGKPVHCNHPTFIYGHLSIYPQKMMAVLGAEPGPTTVPVRYDELFEAGVDCHDDPNGSIYPPFAEVLEHFNRAYATVIERIGRTDDEVFARKIEGNDRAAGFFETVGVMCSFMLHDHFMFHLGQVSTWRRGMGLGSAM